MYLIVIEVKYGAIDIDYYSCHGYYIIKFSLSSYTLQAGLSIYGQVIFLVKWYVKEHTSSLSISILVIVFYKELNPLSKFFL